MRRTGNTVVTLLAAVSVIAGCGGGAASRRAPGTVSGQFIRVGGPAPGSAVPLPGHVVAVDPAGTRLTVTVGKNGRFRLSLPAGTYRLAGYSPLIGSGQAECTAAHAVRVRTGMTTRGIPVVCSIP